MALSWALALPTLAADSFRVESARTRLDGQTYVLDAQIHYGLSELALEALDNGVPLTMEVHVQLRPKGAWIWADNLVDLRLRYSIRYKPLSERFVVSQVPDEGGRSFVTREAAIAALGEVKGLTLIDADPPCPQDRLSGPPQGRTRHRGITPAVAPHGLSAPVLEALHRLDPVAPATMRRLRGVGILPAATLLVALLVALDLMSDAVQRSEELSRAFVPLLFLVLAGLVALFATVAVNVVQLVRHYREQVAGSRLTARLVVLFALISLLPVAVVYYFSLGFLLRGIDAWFDVEIDRAMQDALTLNQASLDLNQRVLSKYAEQLLAGIEDRSSTALALTLGDLREQSGALELTLFGPSAQVYGTANEDPTKLVADQPDREVFQGVRNGKNFVALEVNHGNDLVVRTLVSDPRGRPLTLQAIFPTSDRVTELATRLEGAYNRYRELAYLRQSIKVSFSLTLSLVLVAGVMAALIAAFHTARRLVAPVADIARGTRAVADGDYEQQLPQPKNDDESGLPGLVLQRHDPPHRLCPRCRRPQPACGGVAARLPGDRPRAPVLRGHGVRRRAAPAHRQPRGTPDPAPSPCGRCGADPGRNWSRPTRAWSVGPRRSSTTSPRPTTGAPRSRCSAARGARS